MAFGPVVWIRNRAGKSIRGAQDAGLLRVTDTQVTDLHVPRTSLCYDDHRVFVIAVRALNR